MVGHSIGTGVYQYVVSRNSTVLGQTTSTSFQDYNAGLSGTYAYTVQAVDYHGNAANITANITASSNPDPRETRVRLPDPVRIESGQFSGVSGANADVRVFKGIPFAAPAVGDLRWRPPQAPVKWEGVRKADQFSPVCMQNRFPGNSSGPAPSEDCLYLNVWTAAKSANERRPVIVWTYGGGFSSGAGSLAMYDGEALAAKGAVVVTYNYRLGVFGFLAHPDLTNERLGRLRHDGHGRGAQMGAEEYRELRRRPPAGHD